MISAQLRSYFYMRRRCAARCPVLFYSVSIFFQKAVDMDRRQTVLRQAVRLYLVWFIISLPKTVFDRFLCSLYLIGITIFRFDRSFIVTSTFSGSWFIVYCFLHYLCPCVLLAQQERQ